MPQCIQDWLPRQAIWAGKKSDGAAKRDAFSSLALKKQDGRDDSRNFELGRLTKTIQKRWYFLPEENLLLSRSINVLQAKKTGSATVTKPEKKERRDEEYLIDCR